VTDEDAQEEMTSGAPGGAPAEDPLTDAVRSLLGRTQDAPGFARLLKWLCVTVYGPRISAGQADAELAALGLDQPVFAPLRELFTGLRSGGDARSLAEGVRRSADVARRVLREVPAGGAVRPRVAKFHAALLVQANLLVPGTMDFDEVDEAAREPECNPAGRSGWSGHSLEQHLAVLVDNVRVFQSGDLEQLERSVARLREMIGAMPGDDAETTAARRDLVGLLAERLGWAAALKGSLQDDDAALAMLRELRAAHHRDGSPPSAYLTVAALFREISRAHRNEDPTGLPRLIEELEDLYASMPPDHEFRFGVALTLGEAHHARATLKQEPAHHVLAAPHHDPAHHLRLAAHYFREAVGSDRRQIGSLLAASFPAVRALLLARLVLIDPSREAVDRAITEIHRVVEGPHSHSHQKVQLRHALGRALLHAADQLGDPGLLDLCIAELSRVRELVARGNSWPHIADTLINLSAAYWMRGRRHRRGPRANQDLEAALAVKRAALIRLTGDVLLQPGAEHGLSVARAGSAQALWLAYWSTVAGRTARAVEALELGRALVLRAAASRGVPELLEAADRSDLAALWRAEVPQDLLRPGAADALLDSSAGPQIPGSLRRRVLDALGEGSGADAGELLAVQGLAKLTASLTAVGADALVYLVPGQSADLPGFALILRPGAGRAKPAVLKLPLLHPGSPPLERYLDAAAQRSRNLANPTLDESWKAASDAHWQVMLRELCDWAWPAAMGPVLAAVGPLNAVPRIVLVPCGRLGAIPWHAARTPYGPGGGGGREFRYACQEAVISYAPSGGQFQRATARERMPAAGRRVLVGDPELTLVWAEIETEALQAACYPDALLYGEFSTGGAVRDAPGTPEDLLAVLPGGPTPAAVLHIACHAFAGPNPARSALHLAAPPGGSPGAGRLTVARLLDTTAEPSDSAGPLVVLSACETDLSTRDHDEALTLASALVARGAADVVGSRWAVQGSPTALMMAVFHHFLTTGDHTPADALRAAQLWMLDPERTSPPALHDALRSEATRADLHHIHHWAAFTHQGNPVTAARD
jgi:hypothetical protein